MRKQGEPINKKRKGRINSNVVGFMINEERTNQLDITYDGVQSR